MTETPFHVVNLSGGLSSAVAAERVLERYPDALLWFADTLTEDEDLHRFLGDLERRWGRSIVRYRDGRTPLQVASDAQIIPNSRIAPCSRVLKAEPGDAFCRALGGPVVKYIGYNWTEPHRVLKMRDRFAQDPVIAVDFPLLWPPVDLRDSAEVIASWGIAIPRLYRLGFPHNNCGGACIRQGVGEWVRLLRLFPERFAAVEAWETAQRAKGGARAHNSICRTRRGEESYPITLAEIRQQYQDQTVAQPPLIEDRTSCFCQE